MSQIERQREPRGRGGGGLLLVGVRSDRARQRTRQSERGQGSGEGGGGVERETVREEGGGQKGVAPTGCSPAGWCVWCRGLGVRCSVKGVKGGVECRVQGVGCRMQGAGKQACWLVAFRVLFSSLIFIVCCTYFRSGVESRACIFWGSWGDPQPGYAP